MGSPPHMQGARPHGDRGVFQLGITPAYTGNTSAGLRIAFDQADHPRVCGEHRFVAASVAPKMGSSPRMRGAHYRKRQNYTDFTSQNSRKTSTQTLFTYQTT